MRQLGLVALAALLAGCGSAPAGKTYGSTQEVVDAVNQATSSKMACTTFLPDSADEQTVGTKASASCQGADINTQARIFLYAGPSALEQGVELAKGSNPSTPVFIGRNWLLVADDAGMLKGKLPGTLDKNP